MSIEKACGVDCNEELIRKGLERSCESLGFFLKEKVELDTLAFTEARAGMAPTPEEFTGKDIILFSEIIGQFGGQCFFLLNTQEAELLFRKNYTAAHNDVVQKPIFEAFLLELDNIITASVVTEFANFLRIRLFGGVPDIVYRYDTERLRALTGKSAERMFTINFKCQYSIRGVEFAPVFYWVLDEKFFGMINQRQA